MQVTQNRKAALREKKHKLNNNTVSIKRKNKWQKTLTANPSVTTRLRTQYRLHNSSISEMRGMASFIFKQRAVYGI